MADTKMTEADLDARGGPVAQHKIGDAMTFLWVLVDLGNAPYVFAVVDEDDVPLISDFHWHRDSRGYASTHTPYGKVQMHRLILGLPKFEPGGQYSDHINGDRLFNVRSNLRRCTPQQNRMNAPRKKNTSSRFKGVSFSKPHGRWLAQIQMNGGKEYLGLHLDEADAARAYDERAQSLFGEFAYLNFGERS